MDDGGKTGPFAGVCVWECLCLSYHYCLWQFHFLNSPIRFLESVCIMHFQTNVTTKRSYQAALGSSSANSLAKLVDRCRRGRAGASGRSRVGCMSLVSSGIIYFFCLAAQHTRSLPAHFARRRGLELKRNKKWITDPECVWRVVVVVLQICSLQVPVPAAFVFRFEECCLFVSVGVSRFMFAAALINLVVFFLL